MLHQMSLPNTIKKTDVNFSIQLKPRGHLENNDGRLPRRNIASILFNLTQDLPLVLDFIFVTRWVRVRTIGLGLTSHVRLLKLSIPRRT